MVGGYIAGRRVDELRNPVDNGAAGQLHRGGTVHDYGGIRLAIDGPLVLVELVGRIHLTDALGFEGNALRRLGGDDGRHARGVARLDGHAQGVGVQILGMGVRHALLHLGDDGQAQLFAEPAVLVPHVGGDVFAALHNLPDLVGGQAVAGADLLLELRQGHACAVALGQRNAVVLHVIAAGALDLFDAGHGARKVCHHGAPVQIGIAAAAERAAARLGQPVQLFGQRRRGVPGIQRLLAGGDGVDAVCRADGIGLLKLRHSAARCDNAHIRPGRLEHRVRLGRRADRYADLPAAADDLGNVLADYGGVHVEGSHQFSALFHDIAHQIRAHLSAAILRNPDLAIHTH